MIATVAAAAHQQHHFACVVTNPASYCVYSVEHHRHEEPGAEAAPPLPPLPDDLMNAAAAPAPPSASLFCFGPVTPFPVHLPTASSSTHLAAFTVFASPAGGPTGRQDAIRSRRAHAQRGKAATRAGGAASWGIAD